MLIKLCIQDGFWVARPKRRKESKSIHWFQKQVKLKNAAEITHSGGVLDGWAEICKQLMTVHEWAWAPFISFVVVSSFFFLNLVIAVVCEAVTAAFVGKCEPRSAGTVCEQAP